MIEATWQRSSTSQSPVQQKCYARMSCSIAHTVYHQVKQKRLSLLVTNPACLPHVPPACWSVWHTLLFSL